MRRPAVVVLLILGALLAATSVSAQTAIRLATTVRSITLDGADHVLADIPALEAIAGGSGPVVLALDAGITWGIRGGTSADPYFGETLRWYSGKGVSLFAHGRIGTLVLNNLTVLGSTGIDVDIPIGRGRHVVLGVEYFNRLVTRVGGFLDGPQWYVSGDGVGFRVGMGFSPRPGAGGP